MRIAISLELESDALRALLGRELHSAFINRYFQIFSGLSVLGGFGALVFSEDATSAGAFLLEIALYLVSLFALLAGLSSAQAEREEWPLLLTQPIPRAAYVIGKFAALLAIFGAVMLLLFVPAICVGTAALLLAQLYSETLILSAAFLALGLAVGFSARDRSQALIVGISAWLLLLIGIDLLALFGARWPLLQKMPDLWVAALMLNPLDAFRIDALFALQQIPPEAANKTPLASWWIDHARLWFGTVALGWCGALFLFTSSRLNRWED